MARKNILTVNMEADVPPKLAELTKLQCFECYRDGITGQKYYRYKTIAHHSYVFCYYCKKVIWPQDFETSWPWVVSLAFLYDGLE
jgi:hypothetical protein